MKDKLKLLVALVRHPFSCSEAIRKETPIWKYQECIVCGMRRTERVDPTKSLTSLGKVEPIDFDWVRAGRRYEGM